MGLCGYGGPRKLVPIQILCQTHFMCQLLHCSIGTVRSGPCGLKSTKLFLHWSRKFPYEDWRRQCICLNAYIIYVLLYTFTYMNDYENYLWNITVKVLGFVVLKNIIHKHPLLRYVLIKILIFHWNALYMYYVYIIATRCICVSMHVSSLVSVLLKDGSTEPKHVGEK
jgi:hypothetical protein